MYSDYGRGDYDRNDRQKYSGRDSFDDFNGDFDDRDAYEYRSRREGFEQRTERNGYPNSRYQPRDNRDEREDRVEKRELNRDNRFNDKLKGLFQRREKQQEFEPKPLEEPAGRFAKNMIIYSPKTYRDVKKLIDCLKNNEPIIVDLAEIKHEKGQRILDFLSGALYALNGSMHKISGSIYLFTPDGVNIMVPTELKEKIERDND